MAQLPRSIAVIIGSTRTPRIGPQVAEMVLHTLEPEAKSKQFTLSLVDLASFELPVFNEPAPPAMVPAHASHVHKATKSWSAEVSRHAGYIWVIPEYNGGMAGGTKNSIDYLYNEWQGKPAMIVAYGIKGGLWAAAQLKQTLQVMKLQVVDTLTTLAFAGGAGADLVLAMRGELGKDTRSDWEANTANIRQAFEDLTAVLDSSVHE
ncbi:uncharacterized protein Z518_04632 [Rhinocladiella mackenziei CBS 650.93]|uniref:NADPH-dependent FMN reductase-like domain-containing protein n=1 Tax=Rhinocladiella mackenziei CBS 650.93 TaxID=1442369 RepID=A0A0D2IU09_9EURO|nr:uncharacterized protein Z518_04632 [Rhinocladiella mackenziei CBS 650.93]KIX06656.1 hypothetical protein Z518_04632 [Rhinocladiella mackenziei CBS 650.93]